MGGLQGFKRVILTANQAPQHLPNRHSFLLGSPDRVAWVLINSPAQYMEAQLKMGNLHRWQGRLDLEEAKVEVGRGVLSRGNTGGVSNDPGRLQPGTNGSWGRVEGRQKADVYQWKGSLLIICPLSALCPPVVPGCSLQ